LTPSQTSTKLFQVKKVKLSNTRIHGWHS